MSLRVIDLILGYLDDLTDAELRQVEVRIRIIRQIRGLPDPLAPKTPKTGKNSPGKDGDNLP